MPDSEIAIMKQLDLPMTPRFIGKIEIRSR